MHVRVYQLTPVRLSCHSNLEALPLIILKTHSFEISLFIHMFLELEFDFSIPHKHTHKHLKAIDGTIG
jgi:hypothetical protein